MERKTYAVRLKKDENGRKKIAILKMAGLSLEVIAEITGRHTRTIAEETARPEHKKLLLSGLRAAKRSFALSKAEWKELEIAIKQRA